MALNGGLSFRDLIRTAFDNLWRRPVRNILTAAGVLIGIVTLVAMVSFGVGVQEEVNRNFQALGLENVFISPSFPEEEDAFDPFGIRRTDSTADPRDRLRSSGRCPRSILYAHTQSTFQHGNQPGLW